MMPRDDIEALQEELISLRTTCKDLHNTCIEAINREFKTRQDCKILVKKLLEAKPELEEWVKLNFGEYL